MSWEIRLLLELNHKVCCWAKYFRENYFYLRIQCYPLDVIPALEPGSTAVRTGRAYKNIKKAISQGDNFSPKTTLSKKERWIPGQARDDGGGCSDDGGACSVLGYLLWKTGV
jgi:hypothetical protein